jgi:hypothetical protein
MGVGRKIMFQCGYDHVDNVLMKIRYEVLRCVHNVRCSNFKFMK